MYIIMYIIYVICVIADTLNMLNALYLTPHLSEPLNRSGFLLKKPFKPSVKVTIVLLNYHRQNQEN